MVSEEENVIFQPDLISSRLDHYKTIYSRKSKD